MTKQCLHHRFWTKEGPGPWFLHGIGEARQLPGCVGTWLPPPHGAATTGAQVTQHLQLKPPTACLACRLQYSQSRGQASQGPQLTGSASGSPKRGSGMMLSGFQKLLQFLQPRQILEWTHGSLTSAQTPSPMPAPTYNTHILPPTVIPSALGLSEAGRLWGKPTMVSLCLKCHHHFGLRIGLSQLLFFFF